MPSGRTHDSITLWSLPLVAGVTLGQTQSSSLTLLVSGGFLFSGLMFGPDLDIYSRQYQRWGWLRWIWLPYRQAVRHRSFWSHGLIVGTVGRVLYLLLWIAILALAAILVSAAIYAAGGKTQDWYHLIPVLMNNTLAVMARSLQQHPAAWLALSLGLELGALSHTVSDWIGSRYRRWKRQRSKKKLRLLTPIAHSPQRESKPNDSSQI